MSRAILLHLKRWQGEKDFFFSPRNRGNKDFLDSQRYLPSPDIGELYVIWEPFCLKEILQDLGPIRIKTKVNVNR